MGCQMDHPPTTTTRPPPQISTVLLLRPCTLFTVLTRVQNAHTQGESAGSIHLRRTPSIRQLANIRQGGTAAVGAPEGSQECKTTSDLTRVTAQ